MLGEVYLLFEIKCNYRKEQGIDEGATPWIYVVMSVRFKS